MSSDMCTGAGGIPGIESSNGKACCLASCGQCGGFGCSSVGKDTDCCISDIVESGEACSVKGSAPCYIGDGGKRTSCVPRFRDDGREIELNTLKPDSELSTVAHTTFTCFARRVFLRERLNSFLCALS